MATKFKGTITDISLRRNEAENTEYLAVKVEIVSEELKEVVEVRKLGFSPDVSKKDLLKEVGKFMVTYNQDAENAPSSIAAEEEALAKAKKIDKMKSEVAGEIL